MFIWLSIVGKSSVEMRMNKLESQGSECGDLEWKELPTKLETEFSDPEMIPIPDFSAIVDRCLKENKSQEVWEMVRTFNS